jgi:LuxR family maltose regulon positive regulatory protein
MSSPILLTKLFIPENRPELVSRSHLVDQLNNGLHRKLTLISAPAGFGKTTVVTNWLHSQEGDALSPFLIGWLSLDEDDNDPVRFLTYLITALNRIPGLETEIGVGALQMAQASQPPPPQTILTAVINEIAMISNKIVLVIDDYHLIDNQPVHDALVYLLENLPPQLHLVITTREDPPIQISRLRTRGQLNELRAVDLRFSSTETDEFMNQIMGLGLSAKDIAALENRTEGWIAGLQLAAISMQGRSDIPNFIQSFTGSHHFVIDYLVEEVLKHQSEDIRDFLLQTSILDRLTGSLCDAITGQENGQGTLEALERGNLFIIPLDEERHWYRYHHLFGDLLRQRLRQTHKDHLPDLQIKASDWFDRQGRPREAIKHSLAAGDYERAGKLIESVSIDVMEQGGNSTVVRWLSSLPDQVIKDRAYLCVLQAWVLLYSGEIEMAESRLQDAEKALEIQCHEDDGRNPEIINGLIYTNWAYLTFLRGQHDQTIEYAQKALDELPDNVPLFRAQTGIYLGVAYRYQGQLQEALSIYNEILPIAQQLKGRIAVQVSQNLGDLLWQMTKLNQAQAILEKALDITEQHVGRPDMTYCGFIYVLLGRILHQRDELTEAAKLIKKGFSLCKDWNLPEITALSCLDLANIYWTLGKHDEARESYQGAINLFSDFSVWGRKYAEASKAKFELALGNLESVDQWAQSNDISTEGDFLFHRENEYFALLRLLIAQNKFEEAFAFAERLLHISQETGNKRAELESLILLAICNFRDGITDVALEYVEEALRIAEPEDFIRIFVDEGKPMARLLYEILSREISPEYVQKLLAAFPNVEPEKELMSKPIVSDSEWIEPLSEREIEVLQLIAEGLSRQEVAEKLFLSLNTVKTHARNIYSKLGVNNQMQAVGKARGLGLLEKE